MDRAFRETLRRPTAEREAWAREQHADQPELLAELLELLAADDASADLFESAERALAGGADVDVGAAANREAGQLVGSRIGPYQLKALLATGGMGAVYRAERDDGQFRQTVAIKILPLWATDAQTVARLRAERQILSALTHPGITPLLDGGQTADGFPYLVTAYIDGCSLTEYVDRNHPGLEAVLQLFLRVVDAVEYAHGKGVVHRDLKPANILVDRSGHPHLLDFGIAKIEKDVFGAMTLARTATGFTPLTPEYASPEQRAGTDVGAASDIYQLGLLLYRLLTGERAEVRADGSLADRRPSARMKSQSESRQPLRVSHGDLDTIVMKALREAPEDRYTSAEALGRDLRAFLAGEAIEARPETHVTRVRRQIRRNPASSLLAAALVVVIAAWLVIGLSAPAVDPVAQRHYERGRALLDQRSPDTVQPAVLQFERTVEEDPDFAPGWAALAEALLMQVAYRQTTAPEVRQRAEAATARAQALEPDLPEAWVNRGLLAYLERNPVAAAAAFRAATEAAPDFANAYTQLAYQQGLLGDMPAACDSARRAVDLDPLSAEALSNRSAACLAAGHHEEALDSARLILERAPGWPTAQFAVGMNRFYTGDSAGALELLQGLEVPWAGGAVAAMEARAQVRLGRPALARARLPELEASDRYAYATVLAALGERDRAYEEILAIERWEEYWTLAFRRLDRPLWDPTREDPRYAQVLRRVDASWGISAGD